MAAKSRIVAVATADVIGSSVYSAPSRKRVDSLLRSAFRQVQRRYRKSIHTPLGFRVTAGDEFQWVMADVPRSLEVLTYLRALVASASLTPSLRFRASIGVGDIAVVRKADPYQEDGKAFARSRQGLMMMQQRRGPERWTVLVTGEPAFDSMATILLSLLDHIQQEWTAAQWEAIRWDMEDLGRETIAKRIGVAHQNVTKRLKAADWARFEHALDYLREQLQSPPV